MKKLLLSLLELTAETLIQKTGEKALKSGIWRSDDNFIALTRGERFIMSPSNVWTLVVSV